MRPRWADLFDDVLIELGSRQARALMMVAAVGLSTGALLASVGISTAASQQIGSDIAASTLDLVTVSVSPGGADGTNGTDAVDGGLGGEGSTSPTGSDVGVLPPDTEERLVGVDLIEAGGRRINVSEVASPVVARLPNEVPTSRGAEGSTRPAVVAATSGYLRAAGTTGPSELFFHLDGEFPVAFLGETAAASLDVPVTDDPTGLQVWIDGRPYDVAGFVGSGGPAALGNAVVVPYRSGVVIAGDDGDATVLVRAVAGAGARVAGVVATAIRPDAPERLEASPVVSVDSLRRGVTTQMDRLAAWTGVILMSLTILLIANSMVVAVMARTAEIGLRRALGSTRMHVAGVFLTEGALVGFLGGLVGAAVASAAVVITASANGWTAVLDVRWISVGPVIGTAVGLLASAYPAQRASAVHPALAVRAE